MQFHFQPLLSVINLAKTGNNRRASRGWNPLSVVDGHLLSQNNPTYNNPTYTASKIVVRMVLINASFSQVVIQSITLCLFSPVTHA